MITMVANLAIQPFAGVGQPYGIGTKATSATIVTDNDPLEISFKVDTARVKEGDAAITPLGFTVKLPYEQPGDQSELSVCRCL